MSDHQELDRSSGWHRVNIGHLVMGTALLGIVGVWALIETDTVTGDDIHWLMPIPWVVAGLAGLVATAITGPRRYAVRQTGWVGAPPPETRERAETAETPEVTETEEATDAPGTPDLTATLQELPKYPQTSEHPEEKS